MMTIALLALTVALLPLLSPSGPGNSAPVDAAAALFLLAAFAALVTSRRPFRTPAAAPLSAIIVTGLLATGVGIAPYRSLRSLLVEAYLILLFWAAASVLDGNRLAIRRIMTIWAFSAVGWAGLLLGIYYQLLPAGLSELLVSYQNSSRVAGTAQNPNMAASYLMTSLFVLVATRQGPRVARLVAGIMIVWGVVITGSNGALLGLAAGLIAVTIGAIIRGYGTISRAAVLSAAAVAVMMSVTVVTALGVSLSTTAEVNQIAASQRDGPLDTSVGRLDKSFASRVGIWSAAMSAGVRPIGIGPDAAKVSELGVGAHNDYLAFIVERGIGGALALAAFVLVLLRWAASLLVARLPDARRWALGGLGGGILANLVMASTHELFHFRHLWLFLALAWVGCRLSTAPDRPREQIARPTAVTGSPGLRKHDRSGAGCPT